VNDVAINPAALPASNNPTRRILVFSRRDFMAGGLAAFSGALVSAGDGFAQQVSTDEVFFDRDAPVLGNPKGKATIVEYFDYQCPYCKTSHAMVKKVVAHDGDIRLVLKDWPIFGGASVFAAQAVLGAAQIGQYEVAMEALMKTKARISENDVEKALTGAGLAMKDIAAAVNSNNRKIARRSPSTLSAHHPSSSARQSIPVFWMRKASGPPLNRPGHNSQISPGTTPLPFTSIVREVASRNRPKEPFDAL
jgi:hypothetical protein